MAIYSFKSFIEETFYDKLYNTVNEFVLNDLRITKWKYYTEVELDDISIKFIDINDLPGDLISFDVIVNGLIIASKMNKYHDIESKDINQWFKIDCTALLDNGLKNFDIKGIYLYDECDRKKENKLTNQLIPLMYSKDLDSIAEDFLKGYYPEVLLKPMYLNPNTLAERMGIKVIMTSLSKTCTVFGQTCFKDGQIEVYDRVSNRFVSMEVKEKTILIDPDVFFMRNLGSLNNTIVHECVHWDKHRKFFELQKLFNPDASSIRCQVSEINSRDSRKRNEYEWMEWQACALAPRILMPKKTTLQKIEKLIDKNKKLLNNSSYTDIIESVIFELAEFFGVSKLAAKLRMLDLGYEEAKGVLTYIDDRYITNYTFEKGVLKKGQTYTIGVIDALFQMATNNRFFEVINNGKFVYVDAHFCINDSKYIKEENGVAHLTDYAYEHIDECCLIFKVKKVKNSNYSLEKYKECVLFRDALVDELLEVSYNDLPQNDSVINRGRMLKKEAKICADIIKKLPGTFGDTLAMLMEMYDITEEQLEGTSLISVKTIQRMRGDYGYRPKFKTIVAICIGMHLHPMLSENLISKSSTQPISCFEEDVAYKFILNCCWKKSIYEVNEELRVAGIKEIANENA